MHATRAVSEKTVLYSHTNLSPVFFNLSLCICNARRKNTYKSVSTVKLPKESIIIKQDRV